MSDRVEQQLRALFAEEAGTIVAVGDPVPGVEQPDAGASPPPRNVDHLHPAARDHHRVGRGLGPAASADESR
jgi:hypothetical protein